MASRAIGAGWIGALALSVAACGQADKTASGSGAGMDPTATVIGTRWQWVGTVTPVERIDVAVPERYTLRLAADGSAEIQFDCNAGRGAYELEANRLSFGPLISTRMACGEDSQDAVFMGQLERIATFFVLDGELFLEMPYDSGTMRFTRAASQD